MIFVGIAEHSPAQCPGHVKELFNQVSSDMAKLDDLQTKLGVKLQGMYIMYSSHKTVVVMDAPTYEAAEMMLYESGFNAWNSIELAQAHSPEDAMKMAAERFSG